MSLAKEQDPRNFAERIARELRSRIEIAFRPDTAAQGLEGDVPSAGHCVVVSVVVRNILGGELASAMVGDISHWFNRVRLGDHTLDIDLTADQFGGPAIVIAEADHLYSGTRVRSYGDLKLVTLLRAALLARRAGLRQTHAKIEHEIKCRCIGFPGSVRLSSPETF